MSSEEFRKYLKVTNGEFVTKEANLAEQNFAKGTRNLINWIESTLMYHNPK